MLIYKNINETYGFLSPTKFAKFASTWIELMMFHALLLVKRVTSTNSKEFSNPSCGKPGIWSTRCCKRFEAFFN